MKTKGLLLIFFLPAVAFLKAQQIDSAIYHQIKNDKRILGIHYTQLLFKNGNVKEEGWEYKKKNNRTDGKYWGVQYDKYPVIIFRVGEWKLYNKNGKLKVLEYIPLEEDSMRHEKHFNRKEELIYEFFFPGRQELDYKLSDSKSKKRKLKTYKKLEYRKGKLWIEESYKDGKKHGTWKEYLKDDVLITTEYENGRKVKKSKTAFGT